jgi:signal recognition particle receptor subunit beta
MDGAVLLVDAGSPVDEFTRHLYESLISAKVPFVVFLNKCEGKESVPTAISAEFGTTPVWIVSAMERKPCLDALCKFTMTLPAHVNGLTGKR